MGSPIIINWASPRSLLGVIFIYCFLSHFSLKFLCANRIAPDGTPRSAASHLGLCCLPSSHKKDARLKKVNVLDRESAARADTVTDTRSFVIVRAGFKYV